MTPEYIYGRIRVSDRVVQRFLQRPDVPGILRPSEPGFHDGIAHVYALTTEDALELPRDLDLLASELNGLASDLRAFIETHPFPNDPKEEESSSPQTT